MEIDREPNAKDFAIDKVHEIISIAYDLQYVQNKFLNHSGNEKIIKLSNDLLEHLEYLKVVE